MIRFLEYIYLVVAMVVAGYLSLNFKNLPIGSKILLAFVVLLCAFMYSFRRKQRQVMEEMDARQRQDELEIPTADDATEKETK